MSENQEQDQGELRNVDFEATRGLRYAELFAVGAETIIVYNSMGLSEAPPELWDGLDAAAAAEQLGVGAVIKNGPHWWLADRTTLLFAVDEVEVGGIGFRFAAKLPVALAASGKLVPPFYTVVQANKAGALVYAAGRPVYELVSPDGDAFVMQSANIEPAELEALDERLTTAEGWRFRTRTLDEELTVDLGGTVNVVMDDLHNVYNG